MLFNLWYDFVYYLLIIYVHVFPSRVLNWIQHTNQSYCWRVRLQGYWYVIIINPRKYKVNIKHSQQTIIQQFHVVDKHPRFKSKVYKLHTNSNKHHVWRPVRWILSYKEKLQSNLTYLVLCVWLYKKAILLELFIAVLLENIVALILKCYEIITNKFQNSLFVYCCYRKGRIFNMFFFLSIDFDLDRRQI